MPLKASAPGSLMLLGEYAVLYGKPALVAAINQRIHVTLTPRQDQDINLYSKKHGEYHTTIAQLEITKPFQFVLGVLKHYQAKLRRGCDIHIETDFSDQLGLGSSAAVTVALLAALVSWLNIRIYPLDLVRQGRMIVRQVQGLGSGADIAASVYGGIVGYQPQPLSAERFPIQYPLTAWYSGFKVPTVEAVKQIQNLFLPHQNLFHHINSSIGQCAQEGIQLLRKDAIEKLGGIMNMQQGMMEALQVSTPLLQTMIMGLRQQPGILGAKISGAGLGDCVIGLGELPPNTILPNVSTTAVKQIPVSISLQGVVCEKTG